MSGPRLALLAALVASLAAACPAGAQAPEKPEDVVRAENAVVELANTKRAVADKVAADKRAGARALRKCKSRGPGWERIRSVRVPEQRAVYRRGAKTLWKHLKEVSAETAALDDYHRPFERFVERLDGQLDDPVLQAGVEAWRVERLQPFDMRRQQPAPTPLVGDALRHVAR